MTPPNFKESVLPRLAKVILGFKIFLSNLCTSQFADVGIDCAHGGTTLIKMPTIAMPLQVTRAR